MGRRRRGVSGEAQQLQGVARSAGEVAAAAVHNRIKGGSCTKQ